MVLEGHFPPIWIEGEISNFALPRSGHMYFSLKDDQCQVRCAMFRMHNRSLDFTPANGTQVLAQARVGLYPERGEFQLRIQSMEEAGAGALRRAFEALKRRLAAEGLFDAERKKPLPPHPRVVGVITSPTGAVIRDILSVTRRRCPSLKVIVYPVPVQGEAAAPAITQMIAKANSRNECDALILARGGGSLEDLWAFNDEALARAIAASELPIVSAVGHEVDVTIADFVADHRAPTPSVAAEMIAPDQTEMRARISRLTLARDRAMNRLLASLRAHTELLKKRLVHPSRRLFDLSQRLDRTSQHLDLAIDRHIRDSHHHLQHTLARLASFDPVRTLPEKKMTVDNLSRRLSAAMESELRRNRHRRDSLARALRAVGPLATLDRGYAIVTTPDGRVVHHIAEVKEKSQVQARIRDGVVTATVESIKPNSD